MMNSVSGFGISFYVGIGNFDDERPARSERSARRQEKRRERAQLHGPSHGPLWSTPAPRMDPNNRPFTHYTPHSTYRQPPQYAEEGEEPTKDRPKRYEDCTEAEKKDRDFAVQLFGPPWKVKYDELLATWRERSGMQFLEEKVARDEQFFGLRRSTEESSQNGPV